MTESQKSFFKLLRWEKLRYFHHNHQVHIVIYIGDNDYIHKSLKCCNFKTSGHPEKCVNVKM